MPMDDGQWWWREKTHKEGFEEREERMLSLRREGTVLVGLGWFIDFGHMVGFDWQGHNRISNKMPHVGVYKG